MFELELLEKIEVSHDTVKVVFKLPHDDWVMGLHVGGHLFFHMKIGEDFISRKYTPISQINERGTIAFLIKVYK
jgi:cytochrome-b5 reductase